VKLVRLAALGARPRFVARAVSWLALLAGCSRPAAGPSADPRADAALAENADPSETTYPLRERDDLGRTVVVAAEPRRIVALLPSHTETLFVLGVGDRVVGVDDYSDDPEPATRLPKLGGLYDAHLEALLALEPDLVLASEASRAVLPLESAGLAVWAGSARTFDDVFRVIETIGRMVAQGGKARKLVRQMREQIEAIERRARAGEHPTVYFELDATPYAAGASSFIGGLIARAGGIDIVPPELGDFPKVNPEWVIAQDPEIIVGAPRDELLARAGWGGLRAVRQRRVYTLSEEQRRTIVRPGPRLAEGLSAVASLLSAAP
jgi:iron complex transport system substrate-binding protein